MHRLSLLPLLLCACASSPLTDPTLQAGLMPRGFLLLDADTPYVPRTHGVRSVVGGSQPFTLRTDREIRGRMVKAGTVLHGLCENGNWVRPPQYSEAWYWRPDFAMVKHPGDEHWTRLDLRTGNEERMPFRTLASARRLAGADLTHGRVVGLDVDPDAKDLCMVFLLDADWHITASLPRVVPATLRDEMFWPNQVVEVLDRAYLVHHRDANGVDVDVVYDLAGKPLSPALEPLRRLAEAGSNGRVRFAIRTDPVADLYWPLHDDGTITPKPAHVAGIKLFERGSYDQMGSAPFVGAVVIGTVGEQERFAFLHPSEWHGQSAIEHLAKSNYCAVEAVDYHYADAGHYDRNTGYSGGSLVTRLGFLVQRVAENDWHIVGLDGRGIIGFGYPSRDEAYTALARYTKQNDTTYLAESERRRRDYEFAMTWRERRDAAAAAHAKAVRTALDSMQQKCKGKDVTAGLELARTLRDRDFAGAEAYVHFVTRCAEQLGAPVPLGDLERARAISTEPTLQERLLACLQSQHPERYPRPAAPLASGGGGGSSYSGGSSGGSSAPPVWSGPSVAETLSNARWNSQVSYLSGQTSAYWGGNGVLRR